MSEKPSELVQAGIFEFRTWRQGDQVMLSVWNRVSGEAIVRQLPAGAAQQIGVQLIGLAEQIELNHLLGETS